MYEVAGMENGEMSQRPKSNWTKGRHSQQCGVEMKHVGAKLDTLLLCPFPLHFHTYLPKFTPYKPTHRTLSTLLYVASRGIDKFSLRIIIVRHAYCYVLYTNRLKHKIYSPKKSGNLFTFLSFKSHLPQCTHKIDKNLPTYGKP